MWKWEWCHAKQRNLSEKSLEKYFSVLSRLSAVLNSWKTEEIKQCDKYNLLPKVKREFKIRFFFRVKRNVKMIKII